MRLKNVKFLKAAYLPSQIPELPYSEVALVGRSNVGKSSLLNTLAMNSRLAKVSSKPGKTRSINFFLVDNKFVLVDLPGYGFAKASEKEKSRWANLVESYLKNRDNLKNIFILVDSKVGPTDSDRQMKLWCDFYSIPYTIVATKIDKLKKRSNIQNLDRRIREALGLDESIKIIKFSSKNGQGRDELIRLIESVV